MKKALFLFASFVSAGPICNPAPGIDRLKWIELLSSAIPRLEGWNDPASPVRQLHNPGALAFAGQPGARSDRSGYARFISDAAGTAALLKELDRRLCLGLTPREIALSWSQRPAAYLRELGRILAEKGAKL